MTALPRAFEAPLPELMCRLERRYPGVRVDACIGAYGDGAKPTQRVIYIAPRALLDHYGLTAGLTPSPARFEPGQLSELTEYGCWRRLSPGREPGAPDKLYVFTAVDDEARLLRRDEKRVGVLLRRVQRASRQA